MQLLGIQRQAAGDLAGAVAALEEALDLFGAIDGRWGEADTTERLALTIRAQGDLPRAAALYARALALRTDGGGGIGILGELIGLADLARQAGDFAAAALLLGATAANEAHFGYALFRERPGIRDLTQSIVRDHLGPAEFQRAWERGYALSPDAAVAAALAVAATLAAQSAP